MTPHVRFLAIALAAVPLVAADYHVSGVVVDSQSQKALANVRVVLAPTIARLAGLEQVTKQDGRFAFEVAQAGKYTLQISKAGYPVQFYRAPAFTGLSSAIAVRDDQDSTHIVFGAKRAAAISGQIQDDDSEPVGNALLTVFQSMIVEGERKIVMRGQTRANAAGRFRLAGLMEGNYYVCAMGRPWFADSLLQIQQIQESVRRAPKDFATGQDLPLPPQPVPQFSADPNFRGTALMTTFFPRAPGIEEASLIHLNAGGEAQASITLPLAKAVSINGTVDLSGPIAGGRVNLLKKAYDQYILFLQATVSNVGKFEFKNVPAGSYEIVAASDVGAGASSWQTRQEIEVGSSDTEVALKPASMGALAGKVIFEGERPPAGSGFFILLRNDEGRGIRIPVDPEGNYSASRILPGRYELAGFSDYVAAYLVGPDGQRLPLTLDIASGATLHRDLALTKAASTIEGTVEKAGAAQVGAFVVLLPKNPDARWAYRRDQTDSDGSFRLAAIPSGDYSLIALTEGDEVAYRDPKVAAKLSGAAQPVHIDSSDRLNLKLQATDTTALGVLSQ
jgi:hypothetical protein